jgi:hypothetical protein
VSCVFVRVDNVRAVRKESFCFKNFEVIPCWSQKSQSHETIQVMFMSLEVSSNKQVPWRMDTQAGRPASVKWEDSDPWLQLTLLFRFGR